MVLPVRIWTPKTLLTLNLNLRIIVSFHILSAGLEPKPWKPDITYHSPNTHRLLCIRKSAFLPKHVSFSVIHYWTRNQECKCINCKDTDSRAAFSRVSHIIFYRPAVQHFSNIFFLHLWLYATKAGLIKVNYMSIKKAPGFVGPYMKLRHSSKTNRKKMNKHGHCTVS